MLGKHPAAGESTPELAGNRDVGVNHEIVVRKRTGVIAGARFVLGTRRFDIVAAHDPDETGRYLICHLPRNALNGSLRVTGRALADALGCPLTPTRTRRH